MTERPILFNSAMVRALLAGTKTQTRRIVKDLPPWNITEIVPDHGGSGKWLPNGPAPCGRGMAAGHWRVCPYGKPGERLWVRETWAQNWDQLSDTRMDRSYVYRADGEKRALDNGTELPWRPSIHMPRVASRIMLEIVHVRVEKLQAISEEDSRSEGIADGGCLNCGEPEPCGCVNPAPSPRDAYAHLWESINGPGSWEANPWVWVVEFKRVQP